MVSEVGAGGVPGRCSAEAERQPVPEGKRLLDEAGPTMSITDTAKVLGISRNVAYRLAQEDALGVRVLRVGRSLRVSTASLRAAVGAGEGR